MFYVFACSGDTPFLKKNYSIFFKNVHVIFLSTNIIIVDNLITDQW